MYLYTVEVICFAAIVIRDSTTNSKMAMQPPLAAAKIWSFAQQDDR